MFSSACLTLSNNTELEIFKATADLFAVFGGRALIACVRRYLFALCAAFAIDVWIDVQLLFLKQVSRECELWLCMIVLQGDEPALISPCASQCWICVGVWFWFSWRPLDMWQCWCRICVGHSVSDFVQGIGHALLCVCVCVSGLHLDLCVLHFGKSLICVCSCISGPWVLNQYLDMYILQGLNLYKFVFQGVGSGGEAQDARGHGAGAQTALLAQLRQERNQQAVHTVRKGGNYQQLFCLFHFLRRAAES